MRVEYFRGNQRILMRGAAILLVGGLASGCSSSVSRFSDGLFTGSTANQRTIIAANNQPFPGDKARPAPVDGSHTGSVNRAAVTPAPVAAPVTRSTLPPVGAAPVAALPAPTPVAAAQKPTLDRTPTGSVAAQPASATLPAAKEGWTRDGGAEVTLQDGDSIGSLSQRFGVPVKAILKANDIADANNVRIGQKIVIPRYVRAPRPGDAPKSADAKPRNGDTPAPGQKPDGKVAVLPAQPKLKEPNGQPAATDGNVASATPKKATGDVYTVVSGDTLHGVAKKTGTKAEALKSANGLTTGALKIGQKLKIPTAATTKVATATPAGVDPIITGTAGSAKAQPEKVATYTPPRKNDKQIKDAEAASDDAAPDGTGIGKMRWPVRGRVVGTYGTGNNDGIDISVPEGTPVKAAENGVVIYAGEGLKDFGKTVLVRHADGKVTVYGHTSEIKVSRGDTVKRGQEIARSGMTGKTDSPKLHFEVRENSEPVDPKQFLE
ncbi:MAG: peptidoglycan DD-metalloendopeptidase family protein [Mesorhizobium sp.]|nr:peptidoglycan DD-metalloendopeptidase family protein [Mesorhizobium sp.]